MKDIIERINYSEKIVLKNKYTSMKDYVDKVIQKEPQNG